MIHEVIDDLELEMVDEQTITEEQRFCKKCDKDTKHFRFNAYNDDSWWEFIVCSKCGDDYGETIPDPDNNGLYLKCANVNGEY